MKQNKLNSKKQMFQYLEIKRNNEGNKTMRRYIYLFTLLTLFVVGCSEQSSVLAPVNNVNTNEPNWISLPQSDGIHVNKFISTSQKITHKDGGTISLNTSYQGGTYGTVTITSTLFFPKLCFPGKEGVYTVSHDDAYCVSTFGPATVFDKALTFNITYTGVNLSGVNPSTVKFAYLGTDGSVHYASNSGIVVDAATGKLQVKNAIIPHFSRYGFIN